MPECDICSELIEGQIKMLDDMEVCSDCFLSNCDSTDILEHRKEYLRMPVLPVL